MDSDFLYLCTRQFIYPKYLTSFTPQYNYSNLNSFQDKQQTELKPNNQVPQEEKDKDNNKLILNEELSKEPPVNQDNNNQGEKRGYISSFLAFVGELFSTIFEFFFWWL